MELAVAIVVVFGPLVVGWLKYLFARDVTPKRLSLLAAFAQDAVEAVEEVARFNGLTPAEKYEYAEELMKNFAAQNNLPGDPQTINALIHSTLFKVNQFKGHLGDEVDIEDVSLPDNVVPLRS